MHEIELLRVIGASMIFLGVSSLWLMRRTKETVARQESWDSIMSLERDEG